jgi:hypothetical protein
VNKLANYSNREKSNSNTRESLEGAKGGWEMTNRRLGGSGLYRLVLAVLCVSLFAPVRQVFAQAKYVASEGSLKGPDTLAMVPADTLDTMAIAPADTANEDVVTLMGKVTSEDVSHAGMTILNIGRSWRFQAIVFQSAASSFPDLAQWEGQRVLVTGKVQRYQAGAAIVIRSPWQLKLASPGPAPQ